ncbi:hypothetical protein HPB51_021852 [Rhipicephalus microplus]|uniref:Uncharacterized protein n=1 Tax=Rhipicephalus microplus TaxID=6941 RepID=A0A9J6E4J0_RHIMP|nr:hypothetical protein HPB51_021852 [Rhipicephalus microplus]
MRQRSISHHIIKAYRPNQLVTADAGRGSWCASSLFRACLCRLGDQCLLAPPASPGPRDQHSRRRLGLPGPSWTSRPGPAAIVEDAWSQEDGACCLVGPVLTESVFDTYFAVSTTTSETTGSSGGRLPGPSFAPSSPTSCYAQHGNGRIYHTGLLATYRSDAIPISRPSRLATEGLLAGSSCASLPKARLRLFIRRSILDVSGTVGSPALGERAWLSFYGKKLRVLGLRRDSHASAVGPSLPVICRSSPWAHGITTPMRPLPTGVPFGAGPP